MTSSSANCRTNTKEKVTVTPAATYWCFLGVRDDPDHLCVLAHQLLPQGRLILQMRRLRLKG